MTSFALNRYGTSAMLDVAPTPRVCPSCRQPGPFLRESVYSDAGGPWTGLADCASCHSTVRPRPAAVDPRCRMLTEFMDAC